MKDGTEIGDRRGLRSLRTTGRRSISKAPSASYLDLYVLHKEKERLEKELTLVEQRRQGIKKRLQEIQEQRERLEQATRRGSRGDGMGRVFQKGDSANTWKTMTLTY